MKWKLTLRYLLSTVLVALIVVQINIIIAISISVMISLDSQKNDYSGFNNVEKFVRDFNVNIFNNTNNISNVFINDKGKDVLKKATAWIQILDNDGKVIYQYNTPGKIRDKYTPVQLINTYKYSGVEGNESTVMAAEKNINNYSYTYLIGFPMTKVDKINITTDSDSIWDIISKVMLSIIVVDVIVATIIGYIFSKSLTKPVKSIIGGVEDLAGGNYESYYKEKGIYKPVFNKLNNLADTLKDNERERKKIESMRNEWVANISHDIKTPLASIKGYAELMFSDYDIEVDEVAQYAEIIDSKANYIKELVDDLNLTMKLKDGYSNISREEKNIVSLVRGCIIDILNDPKYSHIDIDFDSEEDNIVLKIDELLMKRVINNIIYNSIIHNNENVSIKINIILDKKTHIIIEDNGKGISEEDLKYIFERYYRGTNTGHAHKGSGLGMAISRDIVKAHNGDIKVESKLGTGTKIEIIL
ncbi:HAMP domain-containing sensor histidine kinase [Clostridium sp. CCUG 7971]|uniref:HAMP domain-containing sensor histidine kinase n=1 Tax=Clostridium sp. CCUG 7971 TaxID=2811414 RepID=UPI001ABAB951|nr:HAMP domain-containing sensor histidine kinase [Clostridium sp. CCUG 7971]MBO3446341.1 HAMP domain-containing histidine kinase [Clostridium sp. CCUG 7971]